MDELEGLEERILEKQEGVAQEYIAGLKMQLFNLCKDYALWDELRLAVEKKDVEWIKNNVTEWLFSPYSYSLDLVIIADRDGNIVDYSGMIKGFEGNLRKNPFTAKGFQKNIDAQFFSTEKGPMLVAVYPILKSDGSGPPGGIVVFGKIAGMGLMGEIGRYTGNGWVIYDSRKIIGATNISMLGKVSQNSRSKKAVREVFAHGNTVTGRLNEAESFVIVPVRDINGNVVMALQAVVSRSFMVEITAKIKHSLIFFFFGSFVVAVILAFFIAELATRRLNRILQEAKAIASGDYSSVQFAMTGGKDELSELELALKSILNTIMEQLRFLKSANLTLEEMRQKAEEASYTDQLTNLYNYRFLMEHGPHFLESAKRQNLSLSVLMLDLDGFKGYNDAKGHLAGNHLLRQIAGLLRSRCRQTDLVVRYGGDEFVVLLPGTDREGACRVGEKLRRDINFEQLTEKDDENRITVTFSMGVAVFPEDGQTLEELLHAADEALYAAKRQGKNRICGHNSAPE